jgi:hypothetical protein
MSDPKTYSRMFYRDIWTLITFPEFQIPLCEYKLLPGGVSFPSMWISVVKSLCPGSTVVPAPILELCHLLVPDLGMTQGSSSCASRACDCLCSLASSLDPMPVPQGAGRQLTPSPGVFVSVDLPWGMCACVLVCVCTHAHYGLSVHHRLSLLAAAQVQFFLRIELATQPFLSRPAAKINSRVPHAKLKPSQHW